MPLGLAKDSMLNLAEMVSQKEQDDENSNSSSKFEFSGEEEEKVMRVSTGEIKDVDDESSSPVEIGEGTVIEHPESGEDQALEIETEEASGASQSQDDSAAPSTTADDRDGFSMSSRSADSGSATATFDGAAAAAAAAAVSKDAAASKESSAYGQYSGFSADYQNYEDYGDPSGYTSYAGKISLPLDQKRRQGLWCCVFPWMTSSSGDGYDSDRDMSDPAGKESVVSVVDGVRDTTAPPSRTLSKDDDEVSTESDIFGEKLSDKERQAVLARLGLAQPDPATTDADASSITVDATKPKQKGLLNGIVQPQAPTDESRQSQSQSQLKGVLKRTSTVSRATGLDKLGNQISPSNGDKRRRSLFPNYESKSQLKKDLKVEFSPMARVMTVKSQKDMENSEKAEVWWQKSDYEQFRKTGRMITKAMLEGGSEIWLATNQSWQLLNQGRQSTLKSAYSLAERQAALKKGDLKAKKEYEETRDKWWHKFGHSRRGLEHIASIDEGRQRQGNVRIAIKAILEEQRRQKVFHREDPEKLRMVSIQHTSWARDLSMASGASDADAVRANFDDGCRKSREFYLLKFSRGGQLNGASSKKNTVPAFMKPAMSIKLSANHLDANTVSQIRFRQAKQKKTLAMNNKVAPAPVKEEPLKLSAAFIIEQESLAKKAAGFASGHEVANMSAVLTGMGAIPKNVATVGGP
jgi:hypothetical protein